MGEKPRQSYMALARKWRPRSFSELIGQEAVRKTLTNAIRQNRLHPVLLFTGPRGTGKTSTARILAKTIRCPQAAELDPCGKCDDCLLIQEGKSLDVLEIDGASNNGVDAVRELRDTVNYMPSSGSRKIYIIDEVHMLSISAFNALLKTLEEPPSHVIFIMATTAAHKIPQTVASRCQKLDFHLIPPLPIKQQLEKICQAEGIQAEEGALWLIARQAKGSLRDSQGLLDQMTAFCKGKVTEEKTAEILGLSDRNIIFQALEALAGRSEALTVKVIHSLRAAGGEAALALQDLTEGLRDLMILKLCPENAPPLVQASQQEIERLKKLAEPASYEDLHLLFDMALKGEREMALSHDPQMVLEVLLLRLSQAPRLEEIAHFPAAPPSKSAPSEAAPAEPAPSKPAAPRPAKAAAPPNMKSPEKAPEKAPAKSHEKNLTDPKSPARGPEGSARPAAEKPPAPLPEKAKTPADSPPDDGRPAPAQKTAGKSLEKQPEFGEAARKPSAAASKDSLWLDFLKLFKTRHPTEGGLIESLSLTGQEEGCFVFAVPKTSSYIKSKCADPSFRKLLEEQLSVFYKSPKTVRFESSSKGHPTIKEQKTADERESLLNAAKAHPFVRAAGEALGVRVKSVSPADSPP